MDISTVNTIHLKRLNERNGISGTLEGTEYVYDKNMDMLIVDSAKPTVLLSLLNKYNPLRLFTDDVLVVNTLEKSHIFRRSEPVWQYGAEITDIKPPGPRIKFKSPSLNFAKEYVVSHYQELDRKDILEKINDGMICIAIDENRHTIGFVSMDNSEKIGKIYCEDTDMLKYIVTAFSMMQFEHKNFLYANIPVNNDILCRAFETAGFVKSDKYFRLFYNEPM